MSDNPRYDIYLNIQMVCGGHDVETVMSAQMDSLAMTLAFVSSDHAELDRLADTIAEDLKRSARLNWEYAKEARAASTNTSGRA